MKVTDPHGRVWRVSRRWVAWRRRWSDGWVARPRGEAPARNSEGDGPGTLLFALWVLAAAVLQLLHPLFQLLDLLLALGEMLLLALLLPFTVLARMLLGRPWPVQVRHGFQVVTEVDADGWRASREAIAAQCAQLRRGEHPAQAMVEVPTPRVKRSDRVPGGKRARRKDPAGGSTDA